MKWMTPALIAMSLFHASAAAAQTFAGYSSDTNGGSDRENTDWMKPLLDGTSLSEISFPGTHDSGTWTLSPAHDIARTQSMSIERQLKAGIRVLDIRCRHQYNRCDLHHGIVDLGQTLTDVLDDVTSFLSAHPSETVLLMLNNPDPIGAGPSDGAPNNNDPEDRMFSTTFEETYWNDPAFAPYFWGHSVGPALPDPTAPAIPTLGEVRGRIVVLQSFGDPKPNWRGWFGLPGGRWNTPDYVETANGSWVLNTNWDLYNKWTEVKGFFDVATARKQTDRRFYGHGLTGSTGVLPYFASSGKSSSGTADPLLLTGYYSNNGDGPYPDFPRVNCVGTSCAIAFQGLNVLGKAYLDSKIASATKPYAGMVTADFPDVNLIESVIKLNYSCATLSSGECIQLRSAVGSDHCVDVAGAATASGTPIQLYDCNNTNAQLWYLTASGEVRSTLAPDRCLDVTGGGTANGTPIQLYTCNGTNAQKWSTTPSGELKSALAANRCLDLSGSGTANGTPIQLYTCNGTNAQKWNRTPVIQLRSSLGSDHCLDVSDGASANGTRIQLFTCNDTNAQLWYMTPEGEVRSALAPDRCLDVTGGSTADGTPIQLYTCNGTNAQKWSTTPSNQLKSALAPSRCLDVRSSGIADGTPIQLYTCNGTNAQKWTVDNDI